MRNPQSDSSSKDLIMSARRQGYCAYQNDSSATSNILLLMVHQYLSLRNACLVKGNVKRNQWARFSRPATKRHIRHELSEPSAIHHRMYSYAHETGSIPNRRHGHAGIDAWLAYRGGPMAVLHFARGICRAFHVSLSTHKDIVKIFFQGGLRISNSHLISTSTKSQSVISSVPKHELFIIGEVWEKCEGE